MTSWRLDFSDRPLIAMSGRPKPSLSNGALGWHFLVAAVGMLQSARLEPWAPSAVTPRSHGEPDGLGPAHAVPDVFAGQRGSHQLPAPAWLCGTGHCQCGLGIPSRVHIPGASALAEDGLGPRCLFVLDRPSFVARRPLEVGLVDARPRVTDAEDRLQQVDRASRATSNAGPLGSARRHLDLVQPPEVGQASPRRNSANPDHGGVLAVGGARRLSMMRRRQALARNEGRRNGRHVLKSATCPDSRLRALLSSLLSPPVS